MTFDIVITISVCPVIKSLENGLKSGEKKRGLVPPINLRMK